MSLGGEEFGTAGSEVLQAELIDVTRTQGGQLERDPATVHRNRRAFELLRAAVEVGAAIRWCRVAAIELQLIILKPTGLGAVHGMDEVNREAIATGAHLGNAAGHLVRLDLDADDL